MREVRAQVHKFTHTTHAALQQLAVERGGAMCQLAFGDGVTLSQHTVACGAAVCLAQKCISELAPSKGRWTIHLQD